MLHRSEWFIASLCKNKVVCHSGQQLCQLGQFAQTWFAHALVPLSTQCRRETLHTRRSLQAPAGILSGLAKAPRGDRGQHAARAAAVGTELVGESMGLCLANKWRSAASTLGVLDNVSMFPIAPRTSLAIHYAHCAATRMSRRDADTAIN